MRTFSLGLRAAAMATLAFSSATQLLAQATVTPPAMMFVVCEHIKPGMGPAHDKNEERWSIAQEAVKGVSSALALQSMTGPQATCWLSSVANYDQIEKNNMLYEKDPVYSKAVPSFFSAEAPFVSDVRSSVAVLRKDLSAGDMPDVLTRRVTSWSEWRTRMGMDAAFIKALKAYTAAATRAGAKPSFRVYEVREGAPAGTFWLFSSEQHMAGFDAVMANDPKIEAAFTPEDLKTFEEAFTKSVTSATTNLWSYNSSQSVLTAEQRATDPFWKRKAAPKKP